MKRFTILIVVLLTFLSGFAQSFVHPGMLHKASDFQRMKEKIELEAEPWYSGWEVLESNALSSSDYSLRGPVDTVYRGSDGVHSENYNKLYYDAHAAYQNALRWQIAGTDDNAQKAIVILNAWAKTLKKIGGDSNFALATGIYGYEMANAAELMRDYDGWSSEDFETFKQMMVDVFYAGANDFLTRHNGTCWSHYWANWDLCNMATILSIGILCDDATIYNEAIVYFEEGVGTGRYDAMVPYIYDGDLAQWQESGRDQGHGTLGVALAGAFCEMAWNQGDDIYGYDDNRLWKGFNYIAKYNLGNAVPYTEYENCEGTVQKVISAYGRNILRAGWELVYNHYTNVKGLYSPYMQIMAHQMRPEGGGGNYGSNSGGFDQLGFGTLTATVEIPTKQSQTISFLSGLSLKVGDDDLDPGAFSSSGLQIIYTSEDPEIAEVVNNKICAHLCGSATLTAWQVGNDLYAEATPVSRIVTVTDSLTYVDGINAIKNVNSGMMIDVSGESTSDGGKIIQWGGNGGENQEWIFTRIEGNCYSIISNMSGKALDVIGNSEEVGADIEQRTYTGEDFQLWTITDNCEGSFSLINKGNGLALGVESGSTTAGTSVEVNAYSGANSQKFTFKNIASNKTTQTINFDPLDTTEMSNSEIVLNASSTSGLLVTYSSTDTSVVVIVGSKAIVVGGGSTSIVASCSGDSIYESAMDVSQRLIVTRNTQAITADEFPTLTYGDDDYEIEASSSSGLSLLYYSYNTAVARMLSNKLRVMGGGDVKILIYQIGNNQYDPVYMYRDVTIQKLEQTISFPEIPDMGISDADYSPKATASSYLKVTYSSSDTSVATIVNYRIHPIAAGECVITASQSGDERRYNAAPDVEQSLKVVRATDMETTSIANFIIVSDRDYNQLSVSVPATYVDNGMISIYDINGIEMMNVNINASTVKILLSYQTNTILFVKISGPEKCEVKKVLW